MKANTKTFFLFNMTTGKKKLAYGDDVEDAISILAMRLTPDEMKEIIFSEYTKVPQRDLQKIVHLLG